MSAAGFATEFEVSQARIDAWAEVTGDANPLHVDPGYAAATRFGGTIAHGHLLIAHILEALLATAGPDWLRGGELRDARFRAPVLAGTACEIEATPTEPAPGDAAAWRIELRDAATGTVCISAGAVLRTGGDGSVVSPTVSADRGGT
jgi:acyl dehydratase